MKYKFTKEEIENAVKKSESTAQVCQLLDIKPAGGNYKTLKEKYKEFNIDISHFTGQAWNTGKRFKPFYNFANKKNISDILTNKVIYTSTYNLKNRLFNEGYKEKKCEKCGLSEWMEKPIPLELHHINGKRYDNTLTNLQILCSNCHGQTDNYCSKNSKTFINKKNNLISKKIKTHVNNCNCGAEKQKRSKQCSKCYDLKQRRIERPAYNKLMKEIEILSYLGVGRKYGVSDNAIRKWVKQYEKELLNK